MKKKLVVAMISGVSVLGIGGVAHGESNVVYLDKTNVENISFTNVISDKRVKEKVDSGKETLPSNSVNSHEKKVISNKLDNKVLLEEGVTRSSKSNQISNLQVNVQKPEIKINAKIKINEVSFPDPIFRKMVREFDKDKDGFLSYEEIKLVEELDFKQNRKVKSVKGIENFTGLKKLNATRTSITEIDLSKNTKLIDVDVSWYLRPCQRDDGKGFIKNIDVSMLKNLKKLNIAGNTELESVDLKNNKYLEYLDIGSTKIHYIYIEDKEDLKILKATRSKIKSLNVSNNKKLEELDLSDCSYTFDKNLDLKENKMLKKLNISSLGLNNLDLHNNVNLKEVDISGNGFGENLDLSKNQNIVKLNIGRTSIKNIDLSKVSKNIEELDLSNNNEIKNLDVSMLSNLKILKLAYLNSLKKLDLSSNSKLETLDISDTALKNYDISKVSSLKNLNISNTESDLIDVSNNKLLESLECYYNKNIKSIDVTNNPNLRILYFYYTSVDSIDVTNNPKLYRLDANHTKLSSIDVTKNTGLYALNVEDTQVSTIDVTNNPLLYEVYATNAPITEIDFSKNVDIQHIRVAGTKVKKLDLTNNKKLVALFANGAPIEVIDFTCCPHMWEIYAGGTKDLKEIKLSGLSEIRHLWADNSSIEKIDLSAANEMFTIHLNNTNIKELDLTGKNFLNTLEVGNTMIKHLDLSGKEKLAVLDAHNTNIEELKKFDGSMFPNLNSIDLENAGVESINLENNSKLGMIKLSNNKISYANFSNISFSKWLERKFDNQKVVVYVPKEINTLNIKDLGCNPTKVKADTSDNYTYDESTGIVTFKSTDKKAFNYTYDIGLTGGRKFKNMTVEITVLNEYKILENPTKPIFNDENIKFVSSSNKELERVLVDEKEVPTEFITIDNSTYTTVILKKEFISSLSNGKHNIVMLFSDGMAKSYFEYDKKDKKIDGKSSTNKDKNTDNSIPKDENKKENFLTISKNNIDKNKSYKKKDEYTITSLPLDKVASIVQANSGDKVSTIVDGKNKKNNAETADNKKDTNEIMNKKSEKIKEENDTTVEGKTTKAKSGIIYKVIAGIALFLVAGFGLNVFFRKRR